MTAIDSMTLRRQLVAGLQRRKLIRSQRVGDAFMAVPRELFVPDFASREGLAAVYCDDAILTKQSEQGVPLSSSSQPAIMALMLEQLELEQGMRVLEIGAGTGYNAALLSILVGERGRVVSIDVDRQVAAGARQAVKRGGYRVRVVLADGRVGFAEAAPYDRIIVTASATTVPRAWFDQLRDAGLLVVPLCLNTAGLQTIPVLRKTPRGFRSFGAVCGGFMPLRDPGDGGGEQPAREPCLRVPDLSRDDHRPLTQLSGAALATLPEAAKRRLLATALGKQRRRVLPMCADQGALGLYLSLTLPKRRLISSFPNFGIGVIGRDGQSLALLELTGNDRSSITSMKAYGTREAEEFLQARIDGWVGRGRPAESDVEITVAYDDDQPQLAYRWPPAERRQSIVHR